MNKFFLKHLFWMFFLSAFAFSQAEDDNTATDDDEPEVKPENVIKLDEIIDTNIEELLANKDSLKPLYGSEDVYLTEKGESVLKLDEVPVESVKDIYWVISNRDVVGDASPDLSGSKRLRVPAKAQGSTTILAYNKGADPKTGKVAPGDKLYKVFKVTVTKEDLITLMQQIRAKIGNVEGLEIRIIGSEVVIDGEVLVPRDMRRVVTVWNNYKTQKKPVEMLAEISPVAMKMLAEKIEEEIAGGKDRPRDIRVKVLNNSYVLEGSVDKRIDREIAVQTCKAMLQDEWKLDPGQVNERSFGDIGECILRVRIRAGPPLDPDPIISVRVDFVTMNRDYLKTFDFRWAPGLNGSGNSTFSTDTGKFLTSFTAIFANLFPRLSNLTRTGNARILKSATLLVRDGIDATAGASAGVNSQIEETTEIPYLDPGSENGGWRFKSVKTAVGMRARSVPGTDKINLDIQTQQTEAQSQPADNAPPPTVTDVVNTSIVVGNGESAALGGIISERRLININRNPGAESNTNNDASIGKFELFNFSRAHSFTDQKSQMIVFITPQKLRNASEGTDNLKRKFKLKK